MIAESTFRGLTATRGRNADQIRAACWFDRG